MKMDEPMAKMNHGKTRSATVKPIRKIMNDGRR